MNHHEIENLIAKISLGWKLYKNTDESEILDEIKKELDKLQQQLESK